MPRTHLRNNYKRQNPETVVGMADESPKFHHLQKLNLGHEAQGPLGEITKNLANRRWIEIGGGMQTIEAVEGLEESVRAVARSCKIQGVGTIVRYERDGVVPVKRPTIVIFIESSHDDIPPKLSDEDLVNDLAIYIEQTERITSGVTLLVFRLNDSAEGSSFGRSEHQRIICVP